MFMPQFAPLLRKDQQQVRYLVVDDSVFARKNIMKMIEIFGGVVAGELETASPPSPSQSYQARHRPHGHHHAPDGGIEAVERIVRQHADARIIMVSSVGYQKTFLPLCKRAPSILSRSPLSPNSLRNPSLRSW